MSELLLPTLLKLLPLALGMAAMLFIAKRRGLSLSNDVGLQAPHWAWAGVFVLLWVGLVAAEEAVSAWLHLPPVSALPDYPATITVLRILAIGVLGPMAEELAFRGLLMTALRRTRLGVYGAILVSAALWSAIHVQYEPAMIALIFLDGLVLGLARHLTGSLYVPIAMHMMGNLFSIFQALAR